MLLDGCRGLTSDNVLVGGGGVLRLVENSFDVFRDPKVGHCLLEGIMNC